MKYQYYGSFPEGFFEEVRSMCTSNINNFQIIERSGSRIIFNTSEKIRIQNFDFFYELYLLIHQYKPDLTSLFNWSESNSKVFSSRLNEYFGDEETFRVVASDPKQKKSKYIHRIESLQNKFQKDGLSIEKGQPTKEIRLKVVDDQGLIGVRLTKPSEKIDQFQKGGIRRELASLLIHLSRPESDDIFMDPMCGSGLIPLLRSIKHPYKMILAIDNDLANFKEKLLTLDLNIENLKLLEGDFFQIPISEFKNKPNKIILDPPWGFIEKDIDIANLYNKLLKRLVEISAKNSKIVIISGKPRLLLSAVDEVGAFYRISKEVDSKSSGKLIKVLVIDKY